MNLPLLRWLSLEWISFLEAAGWDFALLGRERVFRGFQVHFIVQQYESEVLCEVREQGKKKELDSYYNVKELKGTG